MTTNDVNNGDVTINLNTEKENTLNNVNEIQKDDNIKKHNRYPRRKKITSDLEQNSEQLEKKEVHQINNTDVSDQNIENLSNNEKSINSKETHAVAKNKYKHKKPFKKNNNKNFQNNNKTFVKNKNYSHLPKDLEDNDIEHTSFSSYNPFSKENMLFSYLRLKSGFNKQKFWLDIEDILKEKSFTELKSNDLTIASYTILYGKEEIYEDILNKYSDLITQEECEKQLIPYALNKNPVFMNETLKFYDKNFQANTEFVQNLISQIAKMSYRIETNELLLQWLDKHILGQESFFFNKCLEENNVVLFEQSLQTEKLHSYLKSHYSDFKESIKKISKSHITECSFGQKSYSKKSRILETSENNDPNENVNSIYHEEQPKITIKKKRTLS